MNTTFALVDCNNFYASCEKLFRPDLKNIPVIVLSNNDGCVISRSPEAKAMGIKMGVPLHQIKEDIVRWGVHVFSSNYALYADISSRVMSLLAEMALRSEVYSIDECFCDLSGVETQESLELYGHKIKQTIQKSVGVSVCVGISSTKTLAKLANFAAKKYSATQGVVDLTSRDRQRRLVRLVNVGDVWGIGKRLSHKLNALGIYTALDLADANPKMLRTHFSVVLERTARELNGESCLALEDVAPRKQQIVSSRSFGERITAYRDLKEALAAHVSRACEKLRAEKQQAQLITIFIRTGQHNRHDPYYSNACSTHLIKPSFDTRDFLSVVDSLLKRIYRPHYRYAKCGVMLSEFSDPSISQAVLFDTDHHTHSQLLMGLIDRVNQSGLGDIKFGSQLVSGTGEWTIKRDYLSPAYTTQWHSLPRVK